MLEPSRYFIKHAIAADDVDFLVGRQSLVKDVCNRLAADKSSYVLYGLRGVGKTTVAHQVLSALEGRNRLFPKHDVLRFNSSDTFICSFNKAPRGIQTVVDLLLNVILSTSGPNRFSSVFEYIFKDEEFNRSIESRFGLNLASILSFETKSSASKNTDLERAESLLDGEDVKRHFCFEVFSRLERIYKGSRIILFIDEIDRAAKDSEIRGLGDFIKDLDEVQIVFVGISTTVSSLIKDHASAGRKLSGNNREVPPLDAKEIYQIFERAEIRSEGMLKFHPEFINLVSQYSDGVPWIAQHVGFEAVYNAVMRTADQSAYFISKSDFKDAIDGAISAYEKDYEMDAKISRIGHLNLTELEILRAVWSEPGGVSEDRLRDKIPAKQRRYFAGALEAVLETAIVTRRGGTVFYPDAAARIFTKMKLDQL